MRSNLAAALVAELDDASLAELARRLEPYLRRPVDATATEALLTPAAAAVHAGCHVETLRRAIRAGELTVAGQVGRSARLAVADVDTWLAAGRPSRSAASTPKARPSAPRRNGRPLAGAMAQTSGAPRR